MRIGLNIGVVILFLGLMLRPLRAEDLGRTDDGLPRWTGWGLLVAGYTAGAVGAAHYWWNSGLGRNPFQNIGEDEPYLEDKMWHFWNGENLTDVHYWALRKARGRASPWTAMGMTLGVLTAVELLDASNRDGFWKLSLWDEAAGIGGIMLWYAKHRWPGKVPLEVRIGIRKWDRTREIFNRLVHYPQERNEQSFSHYQDYEALKAEMILRLKGYLYLGGAVSLKESDRAGKGDKNLFGATLGYDLTRYLASKDGGPGSTWLMTWGRYFSTSISYTHWLE